MRECLWVSATCICENNLIPDANCGLGCSFVMILGFCDSFSARPREISEEELL